MTYLLPDIPTKGRIRRSNVDEVLKTVINIYNSLKIKTCISKDKSLGLDFPSIRPISATASIPAINTKRPHHDKPPAAKNPDFSLQRASRWVAFSRLSSSNGIPVALQNHAKRDPTGR